MKRLIIYILCVLMVVCGAGCKKETQTAEYDEYNEGTQTEIQSGASEVPDGEEPASQIKLLGYVLNDDDSVSARMSMYGFLHTAETLGYPAKLYRTTSDKAEETVREALNEGCLGLMVQCGFDSAIQLAVSSGRKTVVSYGKCNVEGINANVVADEDDYIEELARSIANRLTERKLKSGRVLIYGRDTATCFEGFSAALELYYPQYTVVAFNRTATDDEAAADELAQFILYNRDIKGMYVADSDLAGIAVTARARAQNLFKSKGAPSPSPTAEPLPGSTPQPTPNPGLLTQISVTLYGNGLTDQNLALFNDNDIYGLCIEPYYEAAAQSVMMLDKLLGGEEVPNVSTVNRPIVYAETIDKYLAIYDQMKEMFSLNETQQEA